MQDKLCQIANCLWIIRLHNIYKIEYIRFPSNIWIKQVFNSQII